MIRRLLIALPILLVAWISLLAIVLRIGGEAPAVFVPFPPGDLLASLADDVAVSGASPISLTLSGGRSDLVSHVYAAGAWLVLPSGLEACISTLLREEEIVPRR